MSLNDLLNRYADYKKNECAYGPNVNNPELCPAVDPYRAKLNEFVKNTINDSTLDTNTTQADLLKSRIASGEEKNIYPLVNHDFDYKTAVRMAYNPYQLGITNQPTMDNLRSSSSKLSIYSDLLTNQKFPNKNTIAGYSDVVQDDQKRVDIVNQYKVMSMTPPYPSFKKDYPECRYPTTGEHSSSYFIKSGSCPTKYTDSAACLSKGYNWIDNKPKGACFKPRFSYIDNSAKGFFGSDGMAPSMFNDILSITPEKLSSILSGYSVEGSGLLPCTEDFTNYSIKKIYWNSIIPVFTIFSLFLYIRYLKR